MIISLDGVPPSMNKFAGRKNEWEYRQEKQVWTDAVQWQAKGKVKEPMDKAQVSITYYFPDNRRRDPDNYCGKFLLDGLTKAGVIKDDSFKNINLELSGRVDKENPRTEIMVMNINNMVKSDWTWRLP